MVVSPGLELFATTKVIHQRVLKTKPLEDIGNFKVADSVYICSLFSNTHRETKWLKIAILHRALCVQMDFTRTFEATTKGWQTFRGQNR